MTNSTGYRTGQLLRPKAASAPRLITRWPAEVKNLAQEMMNRYGLPNEATEQQLTWYDQEPWKIISLWREGAWHNFPQPHVDILQQTINYRVPPEKIQELSAFDGSIVVNRTKGELSVTSDSEPMNILAINLAHQLAQSKVSVVEARRRFTEAAMAMRLHWPVPDAEALHFVTIRDYESQRTTADPDTATVASSLFKKIGRLFR